MGLISRVSSRTYRNQIFIHIFLQKMFRGVARRVFAPSVYSRNFSTSSILASDGDKIAENEKAREDQYLYQRQKLQLLNLMKKKEKVEADLQDEVDEIESKIASLKAQKNKKQQQLNALKEE